VEHDGQGCRALVRTEVPPSSIPYPLEPVTLEELVLGYMARASAAPAGPAAPVRHAAGEGTR
jgi:ABC-2 type transport system ATP-binding protein